ncbi:MAG TPA: DUF1835 domain-containing protein [Bryobacteraceae bacterium]|nr:DUF1835 domain-containing protein [Bryobacteraceae bacterium]
MLHITNGECAARLIRAALPEAEVLCWDDVLHEGPVPAGSLIALREARARFLAACGWALYADALRSLEERDAAVASADEVTLWFEHDLFDQLQLLQALDTVRGRTWLVQTGEYLGNMNVEKIACSGRAHQPVTDAQRELAALAWAAFRSPDPTAIEAVLAGDTSALPYLAAALVRHLEQFPSVRDGLARTERQILEAVAGGARNRREAFLADQKREAALFMGDASFNLWVLRLLGDRNPLIDETAGVLAITGAGRRVLAGEADHVEINGLDRWLGGVYLHRDLWRWDGSRIVAGRG